MSISATGALVYTTNALPLGRECSLTLKTSNEAIPLKTRVVRVESLPPSVAATAHTHVRIYSVAVAFLTDLVGNAKQAVEDLCGPAFRAKE